MVFSSIHSIGYRSYPKSKLESTTKRTIDKNVIWTSWSYRLEIGKIFNFYFFDYLLLNAFSTKLNNKCAALSANIFFLLIMRNKMSCNELDLSNITQLSAISSNVTFILFFYAFSSFHFISSKLRTKIQFDYWKES